MGYFTEGVRCFCEVYGEVERGDVTCVGGGFFVGRYPGEVGLAREA